MPSVLRLSALRNASACLVLPHAKAKDDIVDWARAGGTREQLDALLNAAQDWQPPRQSMTASRTKQGLKANAKEDQLLAALASLRPGIEFARRRAKAAQGAWCRHVDRSMTNCKRAAQMKSRSKRRSMVTGSLNLGRSRSMATALLRDIIKRIRSSVVCIAR